MQSRHLPMSRIFSLPSPPISLDQKKGGKRNDTSNKVALNCLANFYVEPQCIHEDHCVQLMLAGFALHRKFANSFNLDQFSTWAFNFRGRNRNRISINSKHSGMHLNHRFHVNRGNIYHCHAISETRGNNYHCHANTGNSCHFNANKGNMSYPVECIKR